MNSLERLFAVKQTENGDRSYNTTGNKLLDILFMTSYFEKHLNEIKIGDSAKEKLFAMFIRDARFGLGRRDLGRELMKQAGVHPANIVQAGRFDDLYHVATNSAIEFLKAEVMAGNKLAQKWCPRLYSKDRAIAKELCKMWGVSERQYRRMIKVTTTESLLTEGKTNDINFEQVPSLAMVKYFARFIKGEDTSSRFKEYLDSVKKGESKLNVATTNVYDIYKNKDRIDADLFFSRLEKINISCVPVIDTSYSMMSDDNYGKAVSIGHYLGKCTSYCNGYVVSFSSRPQLMKITGRNYKEEIRSLHTGDCSNTDFGRVMQLFAGLNDLPEYLVVLSDMEFDEGSHQSKVELQKLWKEKGYTTKIIWWNLNGRNKTVPELDEMGNIFISGYSPMMLQYLEAGFDGNKFLDKLLEKYKANLK